MKQLLKYIILLTTFLLSVATGFASTQANRLSKYTNISLSQPTYDKTPTGAIIPNSPASQKATRRQNFRVINFSFGTSFKTTSSSRHNNRLMHLARAQQQHFVAICSYTNQLTIKKADGFFLHQLCKLLI